MQSIISAAKIFFYKLKSFFKQRESLNIARSMIDTTNHGYAYRLQKNGQIDKLIYKGKGQF